MKARIGRSIRALVPLLWGNWISLTGTTLTTVAANGILIFFIVDLIGHEANPYASAVAYLALPGLFIFGLALISFGAWRTHRKHRDDSVLDQALNLMISNAKTRRRLVFVVVATIANVTLISVVAYKGITYSNSTRFCGEVCHSVMEPEYQAYLRSPHARVPCAECHIGAGADWFAKSKLSGLRQVWATMLGNFSRPIPTPVHNLRPARETCEECHWPAKFHGSRLLVRHHYLKDEANTRETNVVRLKVGGIDSGTGDYVGIHWHVSPDVKVTYESYDDRRARIGKVTVAETGKDPVIYLPPEPEEDEATRTVVETRVMDCVDCHNRPTHVYDPSPELAIDEAMTQGLIDRDLPEIKRIASELLVDTSLARDQAETRISAKVTEFYRQNYPEVAREKAKQLKQSASHIATIYRRNIFPHLKIGWNTYPSHLGHRTTTEGCFRCHDDEHATAEGKDLSQDCELCHDVLADEEEEPDLPEALIGGVWE